MPLGMPHRHKKGIRLQPLQVARRLKPFASDGHGGIAEAMP